MTDYMQLATKALNDEPLTRAESLSVLNSTDDDLLALLHAAFQVRSKYFGRTVRLQMLQNAKSGACQEDCHYCSQSSISTSPIERYNLLPQKQMIEGARRAAASKAQRFRAARVARLWEIRLTGSFWQLQAALGELAESAIPAMPVALEMSESPLGGAVKSWKIRVWQ